MDGIHASGFAHLAEIRPKFCGRARTVHWIRALAIIRREMAFGTGCYP
jgi:hypothetical protein